MTPRPPRYSPRPLPAAAFIPGVSARSARSARPASPPARPTNIDYDHLARDDDFRHGVDLFNHGFPWEAHEAWEPLWFAAPPERPERALLQGLIHAAAAAVKARAAAHDPARSFVDSACGYLALAGEAVRATAALDTARLIDALTAWSQDPGQPPPSIALGESAELGALLPDPV